MGARELAEERLDEAAEQLLDCRLCPRMCRVNRAAGEAGWCGAGLHANLFAEFVHYGEEPELIPSHTLFLTGCNLGCVFCHTTAERSRAPRRRLTFELWREILHRGKAEGARNVNILGGEPTVNLPSLLKLFAAPESPSLPIVWNSNLYCSPAALDLIRGIPEIYLADLKFGNAECASRMAQAPDYVEVVRGRLRDLAEAGETGKIILRHLILPGHVECCGRPTLEWVARELPGARVSLKRDYLAPAALRGADPMGGFTQESETRTIYRLASDLGLRVVPDTPSIETLARLCGDEGPPMARAREGASRSDIELVISPSGDIILPRPTREAVRLALRVSGATKPQ